MAKNLKISLLFITIILIITGASCTQSESAIQTAIAKTQTALPTVTATLEPTPTPTSTPIPLSDINLESIQYNKGDLSEGFIVEPFTDDINKSILGDIYGYQNMNIITFSNRLETGEGGTVAIWLFDNFIVRDMGYEYLLKKIPEFDDHISRLINLRIVSDVGEEGYIYIFDFSPGVYDPYFTSSILTFFRCHSLVYMIKMGDGLDSKILLSYARKLDARLTYFVCP